MKKLNLLLSVIVGTIVVGCNSGGSSSNAPINTLAAGTYNAVYSNAIPTNCIINADPQVMINTSGQICNMSGNCLGYINLSQNPCLSISDGQGDTMTYSSCSYENGNTFSALMNEGGNGQSCQANLTLSPA